MNRYEYPVNRNILQMKKNASCYLLLILITALTATAVFSEADSSFLEHGIEAFEEGRFDRAGGYLQRAMKTLRTESPLPQKELIRANFFLALNSIGLGKKHEAELYFEELLLLDPDYRPDPELFAPQVMDIFRNSLEKVTGAVSVRTAEESVQVWIDGEYKGEAPLVLKHVLAGQRTLRAVKSGMKDIVREFTLLPGDTEVIELKFKAERRMPAERFSLTEPKRRSSLPPVDLQPPEIVHNPPEEFKYGRVMELDADIGDDSRIGRVFAEIKTDDGKIVTQPFAVDGDGFHFSASGLMTLCDQVEYCIKAEDIYGNAARLPPEQGFFSIPVKAEESSPPSVFHVPRTFMVRYADWPVQVEVIEDSGVKEVELRYEVNGKTGNTFLHGTDGCRFYGILPGKELSGDSISYSIRTEDYGLNETLFPADGEKIEAAIIDGSDDEVCPCGLEIKQPDEYSFKLKWHCPELQKVKGWIIFRAEENDGDYKLIGRISDSEQRTFIDRSRMFDRLKEGTVYYYRMKAVFGEKESGFSDPEAITFEGGMNRPRLQDYEFIEHDRLVLTWSFKSEFPKQEWRLLIGDAASGYRKTEKIIDWDNMETELRLTDYSGLFETKLFLKTQSIQEFAGEILTLPPVEIVIGGALSSPVGLTGESGRVRQASLKWTAVPEKWAFGYSILRKKEKEPDFKEIQRIKGRKKNDFVDAGLQDQTIYYYKIAAFDGSDQKGPFSETVKIITAGPPEPPGGFRAAAPQARRISLQWISHKHPDVRGYRLYRRSSQQNEFQMIAEINDRKADSYVDLGDEGIPVRDDEQYYYRITAVNTANIEGEPSATVKAGARQNPPAPVDLQASRDLAGIIRLTWRYDDSGDEEISQFRIFRAEENKELYEYAALPGHEREFTDTNVKPGDKFRYSIVAVDSDMLLSDFSEPVFGKAEYPPPPPKNIRMTKTETEIKIAWDAVKQKNIKGYRLYKIRWYGSRPAGFTEATNFLLPLSQKEVSGEYFLRTVGTGDIESSSSEKIRVD